MATSLVSTGVQFPDASIQITAAAGAFGGTTASGSVTLTSASAGAQYITPTGYNQSVTLPNATTMTKGGVLFVLTNTSGYDLKIKDAAGTVKGFIRAFDTVTVGLADNSTTAGTWILNGAWLYGIGAQTSISATSLATISTQIISIDSDRDFYVFYNASAANGLVYNKTTNTLGSITTLRTNNTTYVAIVKTTTDQVFMASAAATTSSLQGVVITFSGTTITVGTAATASALTGSANFNNVTNRVLALIGTTSVVLMANTGDMRCFSISGTTVTVGARVTPTASYAFFRLITGSATTAFLISGDSTNGLWQIQGVTTSGTTGTLSSGEIYGGSTNSNAVTMSLGSQIISNILDTTNTYVTFLTSFSGSATSTQVSTSGVSANTSFISVRIGTTKLVYYAPGTGTFTMVYNNSGTPVVSTQTLTFLSLNSTAYIWQSGPTQVSVYVTGSAGIGVFSLDVSNTTLTTAPTLVYSTATPPSSTYQSIPAASGQNKFGAASAVTAQYGLVASNDPSSSTYLGFYIYKPTGVVLSPQVFSPVATAATLGVNPDGKSLALVSPTTTANAGYVTIFEAAQ